MVLTDDTSTHISMINTIHKVAKQTEKIFSEIAAIRITFKHQSVTKQLENRRAAYYM